MSPTDHTTPCPGLTSFRNIVIGSLTIQGVFVIAALSFAVQASLQTSNLREQMIAINERQKEMTKKVDSARNEAGKALAISEKSEANIQWIREGLTELKSMFRERRVIVDKE